MEGGETMTKLPWDRLESDEPPDPADLLFELVREDLFSRYGHEPPEEDVWREVERQRKEAKHGKTD
jgi:hypothetical protein